MSEIKTQTVVVNKSQKVVFKDKSDINLTSNQQRTVKIEEQLEQSKTLRAQLQEVKQGASDTRRIAQINPYAGYFPIFYKKEIRNALTIFVIWTILLFAMLAASATAMFFIIRDSNISSYLCLLLIPVIVLVVSLWIVYTNKYFCFRGEAKNINFKDEKVLSINVVKLYKRLKTGHINVNWMCITSYVLSLLVILINFIVAWGWSKASGHSTSFGTWNATTVDPSIRDGFVVIEIVFWSAIGALFITVLLHAWLLLSNYIRCARIENYYNFMIVPQEELNTLKKQKAKRDLIIFLCAIVLVGLIGLLIYKLVTRRKATQITVK